LPALSEGLQLVLGEIARKREELERGRAEQAQRALESDAASRDARTTLRHEDPAPQQPESVHAGRVC